MVSVESASALITGVSISSAAAALILNTVQKQENIKIGTMTILWTGVPILLAFMLSMGYLFYAEFGSNYLLTSERHAQLIFLAASLSAFAGAYLPVLVASIRNLWFVGDQSQ
ncbi:hypothetical protein [Halorubrum ezzemoulense]|uniref:hypothetical protein n=1 Tax=Halorubrum ezzemoulense TaxID=337243 RepID=UPI00117B34B4|nr:hypothetical protein [Halorubrum ezzemoulense]